MVSYYALTVSPPHRNRSPRYLYNSDSPYLIRQLNRCSDHYILYPEFDDKGRLHYHGVVRINNKMSWGFVKYNIDSALGYTCLKPLETNIDHIRWLLYCRKEYDSKVLSPIMPKALKKGRPRMVIKQSDIKPYKNRTIMDYLDHGLECLSDQDHAERGLSDKSEMSEDEREHDSSRGPYS